MKLPQKVLVTGNSLTLGFGTHGMASTRVDTDWFFHVSAGLKAANPEVQIKRVSRGNWEGETNGAARLRELEENLAPHLEPDTDLILVQLGDNVNTPEKRETFRTDAADAIRWFHSKCPQARVIWIYGWYNMEENMALLKEALAETNTELADISEPSPLPECRNFVGAHYVGADGKDHVIESPGVASHPNDLGMKKIAEIVLATIFHEK